MQLTFIYYSFLGNLLETKDSGSIVERLLRDTARSKARIVSNHKVRVCLLYTSHFRFIFLLNSFSVWICQRLLRVMERKVREQKKSTRKIFGMQNFSPF